MNITNDRVQEYIDSLYKPINEQLSRLRQEGEAGEIPIILRETEGILSNFLRILQPKKILEIGTATGYSAACFATICPNAQITTIEFSEKMHETAKSNIEKLGFSSRINFLFGDAQEVLDTIDDIFDFVFIDAAKSHYKVFWDKAIPLCKKDAVIACDNVLMKGMTASDSFLTKRRNKTSMRKMREFLAYINELTYADTVVMPIGDGLSISNLKG